MTDAPIGILDSGVGGLTVARAVLDQFPLTGVTTLALGPLTELHPPVNGAK